MPIGVTLASLFFAACALAIGNAAAESAATAEHNAKSPVHKVGKRAFAIAADCVEGINVSTI